MDNQNYQNHRRLHPIYHYILFSLLLVILIGAIALIVREGIGLSSILILAIIIAMFIMFFLMRLYPLKAQDRAIRAEENLRHYVLTGKLLDSRLSVGQITALRFASDREFAELSKKASEQNMSPDHIKKAIKNWQGDYYRI